MPKFFVGQPVRIVYVHQPRNNHRVGTADRIAEVREDTRFADGSVSTAYRLANDEHNRQWWLSDQLEPIVPDGMRPSTWDQCIWKPEHLNVEVPQLVVV